MEARDMRVGLFVAFFTAACLISPSGAQAEEPGQPAPQQAQSIAWRTDIDEAWRSTKTDQRLLLLYVKSDNCVYCDKMDRECYADPRVVQLIAESYVPASLHSARQPELAKKMGVQAFPTTVVIDSDGKLVDAVQGYVPASKLADWLKQLSARRASSRRR
jgi:protein disulfide-isomerase